MTTPDSPPKHEWDFRSVSKDELLIAIRYEYGRERPWIADAVASWRGKSLQVAIQSSGHFPVIKHVVELGENKFPAKFPEKIPDLNVGDSLNQARYDLLPENVKRSLYWSVPAELLTCKPVLLYFPEFPEKPYLGIDPQTRAARLAAIGAERQHNVERLRFVGNLPLRIEELDPERDYSPELEDGGHFGFATRVIHVNFAHSDTEIERAFREWLRANRAILAPDVPRLKNRTGKAGQPKWDRLRRLSARRLGITFRMNYRQAQEFLQRQEHADNFGDVLPNYTSQGAWDTAIKEAELLLDEMFPLEGRISANSK